MKAYRPFGAASDGTGFRTGASINLCKNIDEKQTAHENLNRSDPQRSHADDVRVQEVSARLKSSRR